MFVFPEGTELSVSENGINFKLPEGYKLIAEIWETSSNELKAVGYDEGNITCNCKEGSGCNPFAGAGSSGCITSGTCTVCEMKIVKPNDGKSTIFYEMIDADIVNFNQKSRYYPDFNYAETIASPKSFIFQNKEVAEHIESFLAGQLFSEEDGSKMKAYDKISDVPDAEYKFTPTQILGKLILIPRKTSSMMAVTGIPNSNHSCNCNSGSVGCSLKDYWTPKGRIYYCDAGSCINCSLHLPKLQTAWERAQDFYERTGMEMTYENYLKHLNSK